MKNTSIQARKANRVLKILLFLASALPVFLLIKSVLFKRSRGLKAAASNFDRQVGYLSVGIAAVLGVFVIYYILSHFAFPK